jgi:hypothetical protein
MKSRTSLVDTLLLITLSLGTALILGIAVLLVPGARRARTSRTTP